MEKIEVGIEQTVFGGSSRTVHTSFAFNSDSLRRTNGFAELASCRRVRPIKIMAKTASSKL